MVAVGPLSAAAARIPRAGPRRARPASRRPHGPFRPKRQKRRSHAGPALNCGGLGRRSVMTTLQRPRQNGDRHAGKRWHRFGHGDQAVRYTEAWEHETFAEEQARWERGDPDYARICDAVRQARHRGTEASRRAVEAKAEWDARVATRRQANDDAQKARHALNVDRTARRRTASSRDVSFPTTEGAFAQRQHARQPRTPTTVLGDARATTQAQLDTERWIDEGGSLGAEANVPSARRGDEEAQSAIERDYSDPIEPGLRPKAAATPNRNSTPSGGALQC